jgi:hypothetical protein
MGNIKAIFISAKKSSFWQYCKNVVDTKGYIYFTLWKNLLFFDHAVYNKEIQIIQVAYSVASPLQFYWVQRSKSQCIIRFIYYEGESKIIRIVATYCAVGYTAGWAWCDTCGILVSYCCFADVTLIVDLCHEFCVINLDGPLFICTKEEQRGCDPLFMGWRCIRCRNA